MGTQNQHMVLGGQRLRLVMKPTPATWMVYAGLAAPIEPSFPVVDGDEVVFPASTPGGPPHSVTPSTGPMRAGERLAPVPALPSDVLPQDCVLLTRTNGVLIAVKEPNPS